MRKVWQRFGLVVLLVISCVMVSSCGTRTGEDKFSNNFVEKYDLIQELESPSDLTKYDHKDWTHTFKKDLKNDLVLKLTFRLYPMLDNNYKHFSSIVVAGPLNSEIDRWEGRLWPDGTGSKDFITVLNFKKTPSGTSYLYEYIFKINHTTTFIHDKIIFIGQKEPIHAKITDVELREKL